MKSEVRNPKTERRPKPETRKGPDGVTRLLAGVGAHSRFGIRNSFGLRPSGFGFRPRSEFSTPQVGILAGEARPAEKTISARAVSSVHSGLPPGDHARRFNNKTTVERNKRMKVKDVPQVGKLGLTVTWPGRNVLIRRTLVTPRNPRSGAQLAVRQSLSTQAAAYDQLSDAEQEAWIAAAAQMQTKPTLGQSGPLTGLQLFTKVNCALLAIKGTPVTLPPVKSRLNPLPIDALNITNTGGAIALKLHTTDAPPDGTMLRACAPQKSGRRQGVSYRLLGTLDTPTDGSVDITSVYTTRFGVPAVGSRVFVSVNAVVDGYEDVPLVFSGRVPAST
jgi:hypothetical protein